VKLPERLRSLKNRRGALKIVPEAQKASVQLEKSFSRLKNDFSASAEAPEGSGTIFQAKKRRRKLCRRFSGC
jgi:hypothetical protein